MQSAILPQYLVPNYPPPRLTKNKVRIEMFDNRNMLFNRNSTNIHKNIMADPEKVPLLSKSAISPSAFASYPLILQLILVSIGCCN